jgi:hypothetical protein
METHGIAGFDSITFGKPPIDLQNKLTGARYGTRIR